MKNIDIEELITLYDTHGMPPDVVQNIAKQKGINVTIPENFDSMIAELHFYEKKEESTGEKEKNLPNTRCLYYENHYTNEFDAEVIWAKKRDSGTKVVLDKTAFYPDGGGQIGDIGILSINGKDVSVKQV